MEYIEAVPLVADIEPSPSRDDEHPDCMEVSELWAFSPVPPKCFNVRDGSLLLSSAAAGNPICHDAPRSILCTCTLHFMYVAVGGTRLLLDYLDIVLLL
jgi:hypothetical protein